MGGSYRFGRSLTRLLFTDTHFRIGHDNGSMPTYEINEVFQLTPATTLMGGYWYSKLGSQKWQNGTLLLDYALSKRTDVYLQGVYQHVSDTGNSGIHAVINGLSMSSSNEQLAVTAGIRVRL